MHVATAWGGGLVPYAESPAPCKRCRPYTHIHTRCSILCNAAQVIASHPPPPPDRSSSVGLAPSLAPLMTSPLYARSASRGTSATREMGRMPRGSARGGESKVTWVPQRLKVGQGAVRKGGAREGAVLRMPRGAAWDGARQKTGRSRDFGVDHNPNPPVRGWSWAGCCGVWGARGQGVYRHSGLVS